MFSSLLFLFVFLFLTLPVVCILTHFDVFFCALLNKNKDFQMLSVVLNGMYSRLNNLMRSNFSSFRTLLSNININGFGLMIYEGNENESHFFPINKNRRFYVSCRLFSLFICIKRYNTE